MARVRYLLGKDLPKDCGASTKATTKKTRNLLKIIFGLVKTQIYIVELIFYQFLCCSFIYWEVKVYKEIQRLSNQIFSSVAIKILCRWNLVQKSYPFSQYIILKNKCISNIKKKCNMYSLKTEEKLRFYGQESQIQLQRYSKWSFNIENLKLFNFHLIENAHF